MEKDYNGYVSCGGEGNEDHGRVWIACLLALESTFPLDNHTLGVPDVPVKPGERGHPAERENGLIRDALPVLLSNPSQWSDWSSANVILRRAFESRHPNSNTKLTLGVQDFLSAMAECKKESVPSSRLELIQQVLHSMEKDSLTHLKRGAFATAALREKILLGVLGFKERDA